MKAISAYNIVICFSGLDEALVVFTGEKGVWQISAELLQEACDTVHVVEEVLRVTEIKVPGIRI